jgi:hypothetical protein
MALPYSNTQTSGSSPITVVGIDSTRYPQAVISTKSLASSAGQVQPNFSKRSTQRAIPTPSLQHKQTLPMITNKETHAETGQGGDAMAEDHQTQLDQRNKPARNSNEITKTPAWTQRTTKVIPTTGEQEQSAPKKTRSAQKKDLLAFFGEGARVLPPSMEGTPVDTAKTRRSPGRGATYIIKKRDNLDSDDGIGRKKSKSDDKESREGVANLEKMADTPLKPKGSNSKSRKSSTKKDRAAKTPDSGKKKATFAETVGKEVV